MEVLVVDDNQINLMVAKNYLRKYNISADLCSSAEEAYKALALKQYDIILMDYLMPGTKGDEAAEHIREQGAETGNIYMQTVPIVCFSSTILEKNRPAVFDDYVEKPLRDSDVEILLDKYRREP